MEKVYLTKEEKITSLVELMQKYKISRATANRAKNRGYFFRGYHDPRILNTPPNPGRYKNVIFLSEEDRKMKCIDLMRKYGIKSEWGASCIRKKGWMKKGGKMSNPLSGGGFPAFVDIKEIIKECRTAASKAITATGAQWEEKDDVVGAAMARLLELANEKGFANPGWRWRVAYRASLDYLHNKVLKHRNREISVCYGEEDILEKKEFLPE